MDTVILDMDHFIRDALISKVCAHTHSHTFRSRSVSLFYLHMFCYTSLQTDVHLEFAKGKHHRPQVWKALAKPQRNPDEHREIQFKKKKVYKDADKGSHCSPHTRRLWVWENSTCKSSQANCIWCLIRFLWCHGCQAVICAHHMSVIFLRLQPDSLSKHISLSQKSVNETHSIGYPLIFRTQVWKWLK